MVTGVRPDLSRLHAIGSRGFVLNKHLPRGDKLEDRTFEDFSLDTTPRTSIGYELYKDKPSTLPARPHVIETTHIPEEEYDGDTIVVAQPITQRQATVTSSPFTEADTPTAFSYDHCSGDTIRVAVPTRELDTHQPYVPDRYQNNAPQRRDPDLSQDNIVTGKRRRQAHFIEASPSTKYYAFAAAIQQSYEATSLASGPRIKRDPTRVHHDDLPPPPRHWKELKQHPHGKQFEAAAHTEFNNCWNKGTFARPDITNSLHDIGY
ncbi:hypothetical protein A1F94_012806 [Pyrenophora tritici-repentis]|nr:hypothetical protein A1F94_012806 [Pyrenophora tritici-repentis]